MAEDTKSIQVELWYFERVSSASPHEWSKCVVAAPGEKAARNVANEESGDEGFVWTDGNLVEGRLLGQAADGVYGVVLFSRG